MRFSFIAVLFILMMSGCATSQSYDSVPSPPESESEPFSRTDLDTTWSFYDQDTGQTFFHDLEAEGKTLDVLEAAYRVLGNQIIDRDNNERVTTISSGFSTFWTLCLTGFTDSKECHPINLMEVATVDPSRGGANSAKNLVGRGTEEARKIDETWLFLALRDLEAKINEEMPDLTLIRVDAERTWHITP